MKLNYWPPFERWRNLVSTIVLYGTVISLTAVHMTVTTVVIQGTSMQPAIRVGERVWATNLYNLVGPIEVGDLVLFRSPDDGDLLLKRVGHIGGHEPTEEFRMLYSGSISLPEGHLYMLGDNWENSLDSRDFGAVSPHLVVGKVFYPQR